MGEIIKGDRDVSVVYVSKERELVCHFEHLVWFCYSVVREHLLL